MKDNFYLGITLRALQQGNNSLAINNLRFIRNLSYSSQHDLIIQSLVKNGQFPASESDEHVILSQLVSDRAFAKALILHFFKNQPIWKREYIHLESYENEQATYLFGLLSPELQRTFIKKLDEHRLQDNFFEGFKNRSVVYRLSDYVLAMPLLPLKIAGNALKVMESISLHFDKSNHTALLKYMSLIYLGILSLGVLLVAALVVTMPLSIITMAAAILAIKIIMYGIVAFGFLGILGVAAVTSSVAAVKMAADSIDRFNKENKGQQDFIRVCSDNQVQIKDSQSHAKSLWNCFGLFARKAKDEVVDSNRSGMAPTG